MAARDVIQFGSTPMELMRALQLSPMELEEFRRLSKEIAGAQSTASMATTRLQQRGYIKIEVQLTPEGRRALRRNDERIHASVKS